MQSRPTPKKTNLPVTRTIRLYSTPSPHLGALFFSFFLFVFFFKRKGENKFEKGNGMRFNVTTTKTQNILIHLGSLIFAPWRLYSPVMCVPGFFLCVALSRRERERLPSSDRSCVCVCVCVRGCGIAAEGRTISVCFLFFSLFFSGRKKMCSRDQPSSQLHGTQLDG